METVKQQTTKGEDCSPSATLGDDSQSQTEGGNSPSATLGNDSQSYTKGWESPSASLGDKSQSYTKEGRSPSATLGDKSISKTKGFCSHSATMCRDSQSYTEGSQSYSVTLGNFSLSSTEGQNSIACAFGEGSKVKAKDGFIVIAEYHYNKEEVIELKKIHTAKVGEKILGVTIEADKWYGFDELRKFREFTEKEVYIFKKLIKMIKEKKIKNPEL